MTLAETLTTGINNPDCSFFVGSFMGQAMSAQLIIILLLAFGAFKIIDRLALDPFLNFIRNKLYRIKK